MSSFNFYHNYTSIVIGAASLAVAGSLLVRYSVRNQFKHQPRALPSPLKTIQSQLSPAELAAIPYPPDFFPGARDVETAYGSMRVYEWGPETDEKILMIHGDTTPAPLHDPLAEGLVRSEYRVMLVDLWGRGYSDAPLDVRYDARLFISQLLIAIASSPLSWTEPGKGFYLLGFSLGGGIAMAFAASFHTLVRSIVLLAPVGVLPYVPRAYRSAYLHSSLFPSWYVRRRLLGMFSNPSLVKRDSNETATKLIDAPAANQWQYQNHSGFSHAFTTTVKYGPIMNQHKDWQKVCDILCGRDDKALDDYGSGHLLSNGSLLAVFGEQDFVIPAEDVSQTLKQMMGDSEKLVIRSVPGGHGFLLSCPEKVLGHVLEFLSGSRARL